MEQSVSVKAEWEDHEESSSACPLDSVTMEQPVSIKVEWNVLEDHEESSAVDPLNLEDTKVKEIDDESCDVEAAEEVTLAEGLKEEASDNEDRASTSPYLPNGMASEESRYNVSNPDYIKKILELLLENDDVEGIEDRPGTSGKHGQSIVYNLQEEDCDTNVSEKIEEREDDSESEQSDTSSSSDGEDEDFFVCNRKQRGNAAETFFWKKTPYNNSQRVVKHNLVNKLPGVIGNARGKREILDTWMCFFDDIMLDMIVNHTNQYIDSIREAYSRPRDVLHTDKSEIKAFIGLLYLTGLYKAGRTSLEDLWDNEGFGIEIFRLTMSLKRFRFILQTLRFDDQVTRQQRRQIDRLAPVRELFEEFVKNCQACYYVGEDVTIDELLEAFRGRCPFIQHIPSKPAKYGIKMFAAVDSKMYYTCNLEIYAGRQPEGRFQVSNKSSDVVERMVTPIQNSGRNVTADNWFSDVTLVQALSEKHRLSYVGTLKKNKWQIPKELRKVKQRKPFSSVFAFREEATMVSYVPHRKKMKKNVILISSVHMNDAIDETTGEKKKPVILTYYNEHKAGVDMVGKMCSLYDVHRGTKRWPMVVFFSLLNIAGINSQIVYLGNGNTEMPRRLFLRKLGRELVVDQLMKRALLPYFPRTMLERIREFLPHIRQPVVSNDNFSRYQCEKRKRCKPCLRNKKTRLTKYFCQTCGKYLCLQHCAFVCASACSARCFEIENKDDDDDGDDDL
ncbi:piggyBac transposable element-derived protein 4 [Anabrus simplex]|uniref:piggyBac transposable element-derived protein 4 n=1 Tax=Anabrus simplex TaxID=316456 RepID=UPI0035A3CBCE